MANNRKKDRMVKVPVIMQMEALECGAACLAMIMAYYGKWVSLEQVRRDCGVSRDGSNAKNILLAARSYGLKASGYRYEVEALREEGALPCILFWNFNHFVVLIGFKGDKVYLNDPGRGSVAVSMEEFDQSFTGICLCFEPGETFERGGKPESVWGFALERLKGSVPAIVFTILTSLIAALTGVISPGFSRIFMDRLLTGQNPEWVKPFFLVLTLFTILQLIVSFISTRMSMEINGKMTATGSAGYLWKVLRLPMEFFSQRYAGDIAGRQSSNAEIAGTLVNTFTPLALQAAMLVFYLVVMLRYSIVLSMIGIFSVLFNMLMARTISKRRVNMTRVQLRDAGKLASTTISGLEMIETIKASGAETGFLQRWLGYQAAVNAQTVKFAQANQLFSFLISVISLLTNTAVTMTGVWFIMTGRFTVGMLTAFQGYLGSFLSPAMSFISAGQSVQEMRTQMERIEDVMKYPADVADEDEEEVPEDGYRKLRGKLVMKDVSFGYSPLGAPLIEHFDLEVQPGRSVAFVGRSGCGKSTLSRLISGLYQPWSGEILFDGKPIRTINHRVLTGSLAVVDQEITIFEDTIANNIRMWDASIEDFEVIMAARDAQIHEDIMLREDGYQHRLQEGGKDLSGGQRQRLEIARVLAQDPTIVILDEATSALDAKTEAAVVRSITDRGITCIVIAHRLSTIRDCDEIIVLDHGKVMERGTHRELYEKNGMYTKLVASE
ncbi:MAG: NHLP family bacteriocin export ABC transporter peptidase/permease/ATPase subunit [Lachnospiraceae bacterium]|nr:NHLP family bacteriocin export ABC transporter peptidase/permease/ATPase subunit [Lachnospiraceae bacterium]